MTETPLGATLAGKYSVRRLLGRGGMGSVYEGEHIEIGKRVAIKILDKEHSSSEEVASRFRREGRAASRVESDHVVHVFDVGQDSEHGLYMVMEYLLGEDLATRLERDKLLEVGQAVEFAYQAARGLAKAHTAGVIHRDLKPANIFLSERDDGSTVVKLVDFGISKLLNEVNEGDQAKQPITRWGSAIGTPQYMSPEQAQGMAIDHRTDVWSLGAVLYEMLSGRQAYDLLENYEQTIFAIVLRKPPPLHEVAPWVPGSVSAIVEKAMEKAADDRIPDCGAFAKLLHDAMPGIHAEITGRHSPFVSRGSPAIESHPDAIVHTHGANSARGHSPSAKTEPTVEAMKSDPRLRAAPAATLLGVGDVPSLGGERPPTVTGVSVHTGEHRPRSDPRPLTPIDEDAAALPTRRGKLRAAVAISLLAVAGGIGALVFFRGRGPAPVSGSGSSPTQTEPHAPASTTPAAAASVPATATAPATGAPAVSAVASGKPSAGKGGKSAPKPSSSTNTSTKTAPPAASASGQFGGAGVSDKY
jgi:serine/threonine protein kinase